MVGLFANNVELAFESVLVWRLGAAADENLANRRLIGLDALAQAGIVSRHLAPAQHHQAFLDRDAFQGRHAGFEANRLSGQEDVASSVFARRWQLDTQRSGLLAQQPIGSLNQNAGAVSGQGVGTDGTPVVEIDQDLESLANDFVALAILDVGYEADAAAIMFIFAVVHAGLSRLASHRRVCFLPHVSFHRIYFCNTFRQMT